MYGGSAKKEWRRQFALRHSFYFYLYLCLCLCYRTDTPVNLYLVLLGCST